MTAFPALIQIVPEEVRGAKWQLTNRRGCDNLSDQPHDPHAATANGYYISALPHPQPSFADDLHHVALFPPSCDGDTRTQVIWPQGSKLANMQLIGSWMECSGHLSSL